MINVAPGAARQIRIAATQSDCDEMGPRIRGCRAAYGLLGDAMGYREVRGCAGGGKA